MIFSRNLLIALVATIFAFSTLYTPQPMLPLLAEAFAVSAGEVGLIITATLIPLAIAPVLYGYFLQAIPARTMLLVAFSFLILDQCLFYFAAEFWHVVLLRFLQGLLLPAIFTALMTYCASMVATTQIRRVLGFYIGATIIGGFVGRLAGGMFASWFDWRLAFVFMGLIQILPLLLLLTVKADADINFSRLDFKSITRVLADRNYRTMFLSLSIIFFVFAGILNLIPFHIQALDSAISPFMISLLYLGYLMGAPISFYSDLVSRKFKDDRKALLFGLLSLFIGLVSFLVVDFYGFLVMMFLFSGGFFFIHASLSGMSNHYAKEHKGVVNGLYVSVYYVSGALGSWLPAYYYEWAGWNSLVMVFCLLLLGSVGFIWQIKTRSV
ncbi:MAG: YNFM family putative membrane transporter [Gammaproteobacteria bacterium]|jgi:YNFM family putative membrane transporter